jgi:hypothetical protein
MSPVGLDVKEYAYGVKQFTVPDGATYTIGPAGGEGWMVTRILAAVPTGSPGQGILTIDGEPVTIEVGGCVVLEPGGALRSKPVLIGEGLYVLFEYWYQGNPEATAPLVVVT